MCSLITAKHSRPRARVIWWLVWNAQSTVCDITSNLNVRQRVEKQYFPSTVISVTLLIWIRWSSTYHKAGIFFKMLLWSTIEGYVIYVVSCMHYGRFYQLSMWFILASVNSNYHCQRSMVGNRLIALYNMAAPMVEIFSLKKIDFITVVIMNLSFICVPAWLNEAVCNEPLVFFIIIYNSS